MMFRRIAALLRILIGGGFLYLGIAKLLDAGFLFGGLMHHLRDAGAPFPIYEQFLLRFVEFNQEEWAYAAIGGEILVGLSLLLGLWVSAGTLGGIFLVLNFALATTWGNVPLLLAHVGLLAILILLGCCGGGLTWGCDGWLVQRISDRVVLFPWRRSAPLSPVRLVPQNPRRS